MVEYIEYVDEFRDKVIDFWIKICVVEYGFKHWENDIRNMNNHLYKENGGNFWLAVEEGNIVGTISLENVENNKAILKSMYVLQEYRDKKIASKLMEILLDFAKENQYKTIMLDTYDKFEKAIKFYEKRGFIRKTKIDNKYIYEKEIV